MGSKTIPLRRPDKLLFPSFVILFVIISSLALFARLKLEEANSSVSMLHRKLSEVKVDISWLGRRIPPELLLLTEKARGVATNGTKFMVLYFISPEACEACIEEDIETFKNLYLKSRGPIFFVSPDISPRDSATVVHRYRIPFPCFFVKYPGGNVKVYRVPTIICCDSTGKILLRYTSEFDDTSWNRIYREALINIVDK